MNHKHGHFIITWLAIGFTLSMTALTIFHFISAASVAHSVGEIALLSILAAVIVFLVYRALAHQYARAGYFLRLLRHTPVPREALEEVHERSAAPLAILIPSYKEEIPV